MSRVDIETGAIDGLAFSEGLRFYGVPFARAPIESLRFRHPQPALRWTDTRDAYAPRPAPLQPRVSGLGIRGAEHSAEDCLHLNVFTPACDTARRPVLVWFFG